MAQSSATETFVVQNCVLSYPHLFQPQQVAGAGEPKYSAALLVTVEEAKRIYDMAVQLAQSHFKNNEFGQPNFSWPVTPANQKPNYAANPRLAPLYIVNAKASADYPPQVVDGNRNPVMDRGQVYAGCVVAAGVRLYTYNNMGKIGVGVGLSAIMKQGDGEPLGGETVDANSLFSGVQAQAPVAGAAMPGGMPAAAPGQPLNAPQTAANPFAQQEAPADTGMPSSPFPGA